MWNVIDASMIVAKREKSFDGENVKSVSFVDFLQLSNLQIETLMNNLNWNLAMETLNQIIR